MSKERDSKEDGQVLTRTRTRNKLARPKLYKVLFHNDDGKGITGQGIMAELGKLDPNWVPGAPFNVGYVTNLLDTQMQDDERFTQELVEFEATARITGLAVLAIDDWEHAIGQPN